jgi:uncharacterized membrane protein
MNILEWTSTTVRMRAAAIVGILTYLAAIPLENETRILLGYDLGLLTYLAIFLIRMQYADGKATQELAGKEEVSNLVVLALAGIFSALSLVGVGLMMQRSKNWTPIMSNFHLAMSLLAVFLSWGLLHFLFGLHYARMYYNPDPDKDGSAGRKALEFPDDDELPDFWDFMYFSFTLAVCYQVSDISIHDRQLRRLVLAHVMLSFFNVTLVLGLVVAIVSNLATPGILPL